jgi:GTP-binding protein HflX
VDGAARSLTPRRLPIPATTGNLSGLKASQLSRLEAADPDHPQHIAAVERVLESLGLQETPRLLVFNKADLLEGGVEGTEAHVLSQSRDDVVISAATGEGLHELLGRVEEMLWGAGKSLTPGGISFQDDPHPR